MFQGLGRHLRSVSHLIGKCSLLSVVMDYRLYPPLYRYTADQVPYQNMQVNHFWPFRILGSRICSPLSFPYAFSYSSSEHVSKLLLHLQKQVFLCLLLLNLWKDISFLPDGLDRLRSYPSWNEWNAFMWQTYILAKIRIARYHCCIWHSDIVAFKFEGSSGLGKDFSTAVFDGLSEINFRMQFF